MRGSISVTDRGKEMIKIRGINDENQGVMKTDTTIFFPN